MTDTPIKTILDNIKKDYKDGKAIDESIEKLSQELEKGNDISYRLYQTQQLNDKSIIRGILISEGTWKGVKHSYETMKKSLLPKLSNGLDVLIDHGITSQFGKQSVGKMTKVIPIDHLKALAFEAEITNDYARQLLANGQLDSVSLKSGFNTDEKAITSEALEYTDAIEMSLTGHPGCTTANIFTFELSLFDKNFEQPINNIKQISNIEGEISNMSNDTEQTPAATTEPVVEPKKEEPKKEEKKETPKVETPKEETKVETTPTLAPATPTVTIVKEVDNAKVDELKTELETMKQLIAKLTAPKPEPEPTLYETKNVYDRANLAADFICGNKNDKYIKKK